MEVVHLRLQAAVLVAQALGQRQEPGAVGGQGDAGAAMGAEWLLLHEAMTPLRIAGAALIIGGAVYGECRPAGKTGKKAGT